jgi:hypothetical protein
MVDWTRGIFWRVIHRVAGRVGVHPGLEWDKCSAPGTILTSMGLRVLNLYCAGKPMDFLGNCLTVTALSCLSLSLSLSLSLTLSLSLSRIILAPPRNIHVCTHVHTHAHTYTLHITRRAWPGCLCVLGGKEVGIEGIA